MYNMNEINFIRENTLAKDVVLIDGAPRSAKSLLGTILSSFDRVENDRMEPFIEALPKLYHHNKISKDAAIALIRGEIDMKLYDSMISRNINFRLSDRTGILKSSKTLMYLKRLIKKDGASVIDRVNKECPIFLMQTHDIIQNSDILFESFGERLRIIEMLRHPVDIISSMHMKGHGETIGQNPIFWQLSINYDNYSLPYYAHGWAEEYFTLTPINRVIKIVKRITDEVNKSYNSFSDSLKSQIAFVEFDKFVTEPLKYLEQLSEFINAKMTKQTYNILNKTRVPRVLDLDLRKSKYKAIKDIANTECINIFDKLIEQYEINYMQ